MPDNNWHEVDLREARRLFPVIEWSPCVGADATIQGCCQGMRVVVTRYMGHNRAFLYTCAVYLSADGTLHNVRHLIAPGRADSLGASAHLALTKTDQALARMSKILSDARDGSPERTPDFAPGTFDTCEVPLL